MGHLARTLVARGRGPTCVPLDPTEASFTTGPTGFMRNVVLNWSLTGHVIAGICWDDPPSGEWSSQEPCEWNRNPMNPVAHAAIIRHPLSVVILFRDARRRFEKKTESWLTLWRTNISCIPQREITFDNWAIRCVSQFNFRWLNSYQPLVKLDEPPSPPGFLNQWASWSYRAEDGSWRIPLSNCLASRDAWHLSG